MTSNSVRMRFPLIWLAVVSHLSAGIYAIFSGTAKNWIGGDGLLLTALIYIVSLLFFGAAMLVRPNFGRLSIVSLKLLKRKGDLSLFLAMLFLFTIASVSFYLGLPSKTEAMVRYQFLTRLIWPLSILFGIVLLKERPSIGNGIGILVAFGAGSYFALFRRDSGGGLPWHSLGYGSLYIGAALGAHLFLKELFKRQPLIGSDVYLLFRTVVVALVSVFLYGKFGSQTLSSIAPLGIMTAIGVAVVLTGGIFYCRFLFLQKCELWRYGVFDPLQSVVALGITLILLSKFDAIDLLLIALVIAGEYLASRPRRVSSTKHELECDYKSESLAGKA